MTMKPDLPPDAAEQLARAVMPNVQQMVSDIEKFVAEEVKRIFQQHVTPAATPPSPRRGLLACRNSSRVVRLLASMVAAEVYYLDTLPDDEADALAAKLQDVESRLRDLHAELHGPDLDIILPFSEDE